MSTLMGLQSSPAAPLKRTSLLVSNGGNSDLGFPKRIDHRVRELRKPSFDPSSNQGLLATVKCHQQPPKLISRAYMFLTYTIKVRQSTFLRGHFLEEVVKPLKT